MKIVVANKKYYILCIEKIITIRYTQRNLFLQRLFLIDDESKTYSDQELKFYVKLTKK